MSKKKKEQVVIEVAPLEDPEELFQLEANYGPNWSFQLTNLEIDQTDLCTNHGVAAGMTIPDKRRVLLNDEIPDWSKPEVLLHELLHVILDDHGMSFMTQENEEMLVTYLAPRLIGVLEQFGLKFPGLDY